jgi:hypothetical protein
MLFFIGGAARTGKGILARRLLADLRLPYLSLDVLKMGLARGAPEYLIDPDAGAIQVAARLWPLVREMSINLLHDEVDYVFEGEILPKDVHALREMYPTQIKAYFLGYANIMPIRKLTEIRAHAGHPNDWSQHYSDKDLLAVIHREIRFSKFLRAECAKYHLQYGDTSQQFLARLDEVVEYIRETRQIKDKSAKRFTSC